VIADVYLPTSLQEHSGVSIEWASTDNAIVNATTGVVTRSTSSDQYIILTATLTKNAYSVTRSLRLKVLMIVPSPVLNSSGSAEVSEGEEEVTIDNATLSELTEIIIPVDIEENETVLLNFGSIKTGNSVTLGNNQLPLSRKKNDSGTIREIKVILPSNVTITGGTNWNGLLTAPTEKDKTQFTPPSVSGMTTSLSQVIEVGSDEQLNLSAAVEIILPGMTGKNAAYTYGTELTKITLQCNTAANSSNIVNNGECYFDDGTDLIIWTKHFTNFAAYTETTTTSNGNDNGGDTSSSGGGGGGGGGGTSSISQYETSKFYAVLSPTMQLPMFINKKRIAFTQIRVEVDKTLKLARITVKALNETESVPVEIPKEVYQYLSIDLSIVTNNDITKAEIDFKITKSWLAEKGFSADQISLNRYTNRWEEIPTEKTRETDESVYYTSQTPGFSYFAVAAGKRAITKTSSTAWAVMDTIESHYKKGVPGVWETMDTIEQYYGGG
jgi:PGF-pre-PGF domain-containing protein